MGWMSSPAPPPAPDYSAIQTQANEWAPIQHAIQQAQRFGRKYTYVVPGSVTEEKPEGDIKSVDYTGMGEIDYAQKMQDYYSSTLDPNARQALGLYQNLGPEFVASSRAQLQQADPYGFAAREQLGKDIAAQPIPTLPQAPEWEMAGLGQQAPAGQPTAAAGRQGSAVPSTPYPKYTAPEGGREGGWQSSGMAEGIRERLRGGQPRQQKENLEGPSYRAPAQPYESPSFLTQDRETFKAAPVHPDERGGQPPVDDFVDETITTTTETERPVNPEWQAAVDSGEIWYNKDYEVVDPETKRQTGERGGWVTREPQAGLEVQEGAWTAGVPSQYLEQPIQQPVQQPTQTLGFGEGGGGSTGFGDVVTPLGGGGGAVDPRIAEDQQRYDDIIRQRMEHDMLRQRTEDGLPRQQTQSGFGSVAGGFLGSRPPVEPGGGQITGPPPDYLRDYRGAVGQFAAGSPYRAQGDADVATPAGTYQRGLPTYEEIERGRTYGRAEDAEAMGRLGEGPSYERLTQEMIPDMQATGESAYGRGTLESGLLDRLSSGRTSRAVADRARQDALGQQAGRGNIFGGGAVIERSRAAQEAEEGQQARDFSNYLTFLQSGQSEEAVMNRMAQQNLANRMAGIQQRTGATQLERADEAARVDQMNAARQQEFQNQLAALDQRAGVGGQERAERMAGIGQRNLASEKGYADYMNALAQRNQAKQQTYQNIMGKTLQEQGLQQQRLGNLQAYAFGQPLTSQLGSLSGMQTQAAPYMPTQVAGVGTPLGQQSQLAQNFALNRYGTQGSIYGSQAAGGGGFGQLVGTAIGAAGAADKSLPAFLAGICHVARLVFGNRNPEWVEFYNWKETKAPKWFRNFYNRFSEKIANWMKNKPRVQSAVRSWMRKKIKQLHSKGA